MTMEYKNLAVDGFDIRLSGFDIDPYFRDIEKHVTSATMSPFLHLLRAFKPDRLFDIGANIGVTTLLARAVLPEAEIVAVEPSPRAGECLAASLQNAGVAAEIVQACIGEFDGEIGFVEEKFLAGSHRGANGRPTRMLTLDSLTIAHGAPDFIKIDVEGFEENVLAGAGPTTLARDPVFFMEFNAYCLCAFAKISPYKLAERVVRDFGGFHYLRSDQTPQFVKSEDEIVIFLHDLIGRRRIIVDVAFSRDTGKHDAIMAALGAG